MLTIVSPKPSPLTKVKAVPRCSGDTLWATRVENCGESGERSRPHTNKKGMGAQNANLGKTYKINPQVPEPIKLAIATVPLPSFWEINPLSEQEIPPMPINTKVHRDWVAGDSVFWVR